MKQHIGLALYHIAVRLCPAIPLAMLNIAQQHGERLAQQALNQAALQAAIKQHQHTVAERAARQ